MKKFSIGRVQGFNPISLKLIKAARCLLVQTKSKILGR